MDDFKYQIVFEKDSYCGNRWATDEYLRFLDKCNLTRTTWGQLKKWFHNLYGEENVCFEEGFGVSFKNSEDFVDFTLKYYY